MADNKQVKSIGEFYACALLARHGWAPALTRDGLARTDVLATRSGTQDTITVQVKTTTGDRFVLGSQPSAVGAREWFVLVKIDPDPAGPMRCFVVPRDHVAAATWICHQNWLTDPAAPRSRTAGQGASRVSMDVFERYENRWDLLDAPSARAPVLLPDHYRALALDPRVGLPEGHPWRGSLPTW